MEEAIQMYLQSLQRDIPSSIYEGLFSLLVLAILVTIAIKGIKRGYRYVLTILLSEYVFLIYCSTVFFRPTNDFLKYKYTPFWSYAVLSEGHLLMPDMIMNILVFVPVGFLIGITFRSIKWWKVLMAGFVISSGIELLQLLLRRGVSEFDDVFHNTIGCVVGYFVACLFARLTCKSVRTMIKK